VKTFFVGIISALLLGPSLVWGYFALGFAPIRSDCKPSALETALMRRIVSASVRHENVGTRPSGPATEQMVIAGGKLYVEGCQGCHGELGKAFHEDEAHFPPVPQFPQVGTRYSRTEAAWIVRHGIRMTAMSAYGRFYTEEQVSDLAAFVVQSDHLRPETLRNIANPR